MTVNVTGSCREHRMLDGLDGLQDGDKGFGNWLRRRRGHLWKGQTKRAMYPFLRSSLLGLLFFLLKVYVTYFASISAVDIPFSSHSVTSVHIGNHYNLFFIKLYLYSILLRRMSKQFLKWRDGVLHRARILCE